MNNKTTKICCTLALLASVAATPAFSQTKNFQGAMIGLGVNQTAATTGTTISSSANSVTLKYDNGDYSTVPFVDASYSIPLSNNFLLRVGGKYDFSKSKSGSISTDVTAAAGDLVLDDDLDGDGNYVNIGTIREQIKLNYNYKFNNDSKDNFLGLGWAYNNIKSGIWSDGYISSLLLNIEDKNKDLIFKINCEPYLNIKHVNQDLEIYYNNILIKKIHFKFGKQNDNLIIFELKKELITNNNIELVFKFKNPGSPSDYNESPDSKKLGILLKDISVKEKTI